MEHVKTHKIHPCHLRPGDTISLTYGWEEPAEKWNERILTMDTIDTEMTIDTVIVYRVENEFGLKAGRALVMGEDDGTYKGIPITEGRIPRRAA